MIRILYRLMRQAESLSPECLGRPYEFRGTPTTRQFDIIKSAWIELRQLLVYYGAVMISFLDRAGVPAHVLVRILDKEAVLLNLETERYFGLDETGTRMWQLTTAAPNIETAYRQLLDEYDVNPDTLRENLAELLENLADGGLLNLAPFDVGTAPAI